MARKRSDAAATEDQGELFAAEETPKKKKRGRKAKEPVADVEEEPEPEGAPRKARRGGKLKAPAPVLTLSGFSRSESEELHRYAQDLLNERE